MTSFSLLNYVPISGEQSVLSAGCWINIECNVIPAITTEMGISKAHIGGSVCQLCFWGALGEAHGKIGHFQLGSSPTGLRRECDDFWIQ